VAAGPVILASNPGMIVSPAVPQTDNAVAFNFERFDGLAARNNPGGGPGNPRGPSIQPGELDHPADFDPLSGGTGGGGSMYGWNNPGGSPRPGGSDQPEGQVYTEGPLQGVVGTLGGQPYPVSPRIYKDTGDYTHSKWPTVQWRIGVGQHGPSSLGAQNTVQLSEITNSPPVPGDLTGIIAGLA
jgi:hypothetical protein